MAENNIRLSRKTICPEPRLLINFSNTEFIASDDEILLLSEPFLLATSPRKGRGSQHIIFIES